MAKRLFYQTLSQRYGTFYIGCEQRQTVRFIKTATIIRKQKQEEVGKTKKVQEKYKLHT